MLTAQEKEEIAIRVAINGETLRSVGDSFKLSAERMRQVTYAWMRDNGCTLRVRECKCWNPDTKLVERKELCSACKMRCKYREHMDICDKAWREGV